MAEPSVEVSVATVPCVLVNGLLEEAIDVTAVSILVIASGVDRNNVAVVTPDFAVVEADPNGVDADSVLFRGSVVIAVLAKVDPIDVESGSDVPAVLITDVSEVLIGLVVMAGFAVDSCDVAIFSVLTDVLEVDPNDVDVGTVLNAEFDVDPADDDSINSVVAIIGTVDASEVASGSTLVIDLIVDVNTAVVCVDPRDVDGGSVRKVGLLEDAMLVDAGAVVIGSVLAIVIGVDPREVSVGLVRAMGVIEETIDVDAVAVLYAGAVGNEDSVGVDSVVSIATRVEANDAVLVSVLRTELVDDAEDVVIKPVVTTVVKTDANEVAPNRVLIAGLLVEASNIVIKPVAIALVSVDPNETASYLVLATELVDAVLTVEANEVSPNPIVDAVMDSVTTVGVKIDENDDAAAVVLTLGLTVDGDVAAVDAVGSVDT